MQARWEAEKAAAAARAAVREKKRKEEEAIKAAHYARKNLYQQRWRLVDAAAKYAKRRSQQPRKVRLYLKPTVFVWVTTLNFDLKLFDLICRVCLCTAH